MDTKEPFSEEMIGSKYFIHTRVGNWLHTRETVTGEGYWTWLGPGKLLTSAENGGTKCVRASA